MFASELMEAVRKNPEKYDGKRYKVVKGSATNIHGDHINDVKILENDMYDKNGHMVWFNKNTQVEEIKQPVTWHEAIQAWANKKTIRCDFRGDVMIYGGDQIFKDHKNRPLVRAELIDGVWYIDD